MDWDTIVVLTTVNLGEIMEVDRQLKFKSHERMQVEFISNNVDVTTHDCLSSVALALVYCFGGLFVWVVSRLCWRQVNITSIPKGPPSSSVANYRPISITLVWSKVLEHLVSVRLGRFMERSSVLIGKVWVPVMQFCACPYTAKCIGEWAGGYDRAD